MAGRSSGGFWKIDRLVRYGKDPASLASAQNTVVSLESRRTDNVIHTPPTGTIVADSRFFAYWTVKNNVALCV